MIGNDTALDRQHRVSEHLAALATAAEAAVELTPVVAGWAERLAEVFTAGGRVLTCGNGGSASEAQHLTGELVGRFRHDRQPLSAIALCADSSATTAIMNDYGVEDVFARQVRAHGRPGDVLIAFSTSGTSPNVVAAAKAALETGVTVWALTGPAPNPLAALSDSAIPVIAATVATVQEIHLSMVHALCIALDDALGVPT
ncbi:MAG TPA: SIS domain-containing protein [Propionibacteriaceae bacterium]|jgi:D-sedoheptulose 7-phosphate isomerase|nr:SIS domain-containing protein [Propionibacteriaceae bacterium]